MKDSNAIIFTDLDGTLLDHHSYSFEEACPALEQLKLKRVPVIPVTSKTYAELIVLRKQLGFDDPFVVENGAAIYLPKNSIKEKPEDVIDKHGYWVKSFTRNRDEWRSLIADVKKQFPTQMRTFSEIGDEGVAKATGLPIREAALANQREFSEPIHWIGDDIAKEKFKQVMLEQKIEVLEGGRFLHCVDGYDKGSAVKWLVLQYKKIFESFETIALGDSHNDIALLNACDVAILIRSNAHALPVLDRHPNSIVSRLKGPAGWNQTL